MTDAAVDQPAVKQTSALSVWSLVLGILGIVPLGLLAAIPAVICGHIAIPKISRSRGALGGNGMAIGGLVTGYIAIALNVLILPGLLLPALAAARQRARQTKCMVNLSMIGKSCIMHSMDHEDRLPSSLKELAETQADVLPYLVCPTTGNTPGDAASADQWSDYVLVPNRSTSDDSDTVLAFSKPHCYPGRGGNVLAVCGSVKWYDLNEYQKLTAEFQK